MKALVYKSTGSWYIVKDDSGKFWNARMKGIFKMEEITSTNPVAVGDEVEIEPENELENSAMIIQIHDRRNYINRQSPRFKHQQHIVASNLDQSLLLATLREPRTSQGFIDRFLVASEAYHIPALIVFNKADVYRKKELEKFEEMKAMYEAVGYKIFLISVLEKKGIEMVHQELKDKITLISGHSGVGKSSFINHLFPGKSLQTKDISGWSGKGQHTTTFAEMFDFPPPDLGKIIDTPGMREFGLVNMTKQELSHYFREMRDLINECQFNNCLHVDEPGCAVKVALEAGKINLDRYISYVNILDSIDEKFY